MLWAYKLWKQSICDFEHHSEAAQRIISCVINFWKSSGCPLADWLIWTRKPVIQLSQIPGKCILFVPNVWKTQDHESIKSTGRWGCLGRVCINGIFPIPSLFWMLDHVVGIQTLKTIYLSMVLNIILRPHKESFLTYSTFRSFWVAHWLTASTCRW